MSNVLKVFFVKFFQVLNGEIDKYIRRVRKGEKG